MEQTESSEEAAAATNTQTTINNNNTDEEPLNRNLFSNVRYYLINSDSSEVN